MLYIFLIFVYIFTYVRCVGVFISLQFISSFFLCTAFLSYFLIRPNKDRTKDFHVNVSLKVAVKFRRELFTKPFFKILQKGFVAARTVYPDIPIRCRLFRQIYFGGLCIGFCYKQIHIMPSTSV